MGRGAFFIWTPGLDTCINCWWINSSTSLNNNRRSHHKMKVFQVSQFDNWIRPCVKCWNIFLTPKIGLWSCSSSFSLLWYFHLTLKHWIRSLLCWSLYLCSIFGTTDVSFAPKWGQIGTKWNISSKDFTEPKRFVPFGANLTPFC